MPFNSPFFLFVFLPPLVGLFLLAGRRWRGPLLLLASLAFLLWSDPLFFPLIVGLLLFTFWAGRRVERCGRTFFVLALGAPLGVLLLFKIYSAYGQNLLAALGVPAALLASLRQLPAYPLGLSFLVFQALAYLVDVRRGAIPAETRLPRFALTLLFFPKLAAGPIVRYGPTAQQMDGFSVHADDLAQGARRFIRGLAKKAILADTLGGIIGRGVFVSLGGLDTPQAWFVLACYTLQIYYDFSGYTDMALGLGRMLGVRLPENFNYPYAASSVADFWRRWHMTLSSWFRDYLFYPLELRRRRAAAAGQSLNILLVFGLTGLWHGVTPNFLLWGLWHGAFIALEAAWLGRRLKRLPRGVQSLYTLLVVMLGWVLFRTPTPGHALVMLGALSGIAPGPGVNSYFVFAMPGALGWGALILGALFSLPLAEWLRPRLAGWMERPALRLAADAGWLLLLALSVVFIAASSYQPYIYGGF